MPKNDPAGYLPNVQKSRKKGKVSESLKKLAKLRAAKKGKK